MKSLGTDRDILRIENVVAGYEIEDEAYVDIDYILINMSFSINKAYFVSKKR